MIAEKLDIWSIRNLSLVNKYWNNLLNSDILWRNKTLEILPSSFIGVKCNEKKENVWKNYYSELYKVWNDPDYVYQIFRALIEERNDIIYVIFMKRKLDPNYTFVLRSHFEREINCYYALKERIDGPWCFSPIKMVIRANNIQLWNFFKTHYTLELNSDLFYECIPDFSNHAVIYSLDNEENLRLLQEHKNSRNVILEDLVNFDVEITPKILLFAMERNNLNAMKILLDKIDAGNLRAAILEIFHLSESRSKEYMNYQYFRLGKKHEVFRYFVTYERVAIFLYDNRGYIESNPVLKRILS